MVLVVGMNLTGGMWTYSFSFVFSASHKKCPINQALPVLEMIIYLIEIYL
jgi:hypothetical protein